MSHVMYVEIKMYHLYYILNRQKRECYYKGAFIAPSEEVDKHIQKMYKGAKQKVHLITCFMVAFNTKYFKMFTISYIRTRTCNYMCNDFTLLFFCF